MSDFYPRSPCGERHKAGNIVNAAIRISIHALLAESDLMEHLDCKHTKGFLSTLSLRRATMFPGILPHHSRISIHALLAESDRGGHISKARSEHFYPRSPCGERRKSNKLTGLKLVFLSTLSLRRATVKGKPASPVIGISIHALLAESDPEGAAVGYYVTLFLSTLSLRRATSIFKNNILCSLFLSTLSLRRATLLVM